MLYIGIDTGTDTGLAVWNGRHFTHLQTMKIHKALEYVAALATANPGAVCVVIEDARQRKWIPKEGSIKERVGRAQGAGSVKRDASIWTEFCKDKKIHLLAVPPRKGMTKWDEDYWRKVTGWKGRTSEHARDAALLVWGK